MRASGLTALTEANRRHFGVTMAATMGDLTEKGWGDLHASDRAGRPAVYRLVYTLQHIVRRVRRADGNR